MASEFRVVALLAAYNEADVIEQVIAHLVAQRIEVYFIDDGSTDDTAAIAERHLGRGVVGIDRTPHRDGPGSYSWTEILRRKETLAARLDADWFIHHDADELRDSPSAALDLHDAIRHVDRLGYNAISFALLNFPPTNDAFRPGDPLEERFRFYEHAKPFDGIQVKSWKKTASPVDLVSTGGHEARFPGRCVCPMPFVTRHYPVRSQAHGQRKVFSERKPRFAEGERARGWHVQYDRIS